MAGSGGTSRTLSPTDDTNKNSSNIKVVSDRLQSLSQSCAQILEMVGGEMFAGELGPSTVVGSAAFNLFVISAVCVYCIPDGEVRGQLRIPNFERQLFLNYLIGFEIVVCTSRDVTIWIENVSQTSQQESCN